MSTASDKDFSPENHAISVSDLVRQARRTLETRFPLRWISGEVSSLTRAVSGHLYFSLRDEATQVRCVMYRSRAQLVPFRLVEGMRVELHALATLYEARGEFQLQVEAIREAGRGRLFEDFLRLKEKLAAEGLFVPERKRALPELPRGIGIVTSLHAAALHDIRITLLRRAPHVPLVLYPSPVQGAEASAQLTAQIRIAGRRAKADGVDVLLLCRGGGSLEDLWAFNDEALVRAIVESPIPVVSGIGHETDFTLSDFAADLRAATPTAAAEIVSAGHHAAIGRVQHLAAGLLSRIRRRIDAAWEKIDRSRGRLLHPRQNLNRQHQRLGLLQQRLTRAMQWQQERRASGLALLTSRLQARRPAPAIERERLTALSERFRRGGARVLANRSERIANLSTQLGHLNPQAVLERGYSIVRCTGGELLHSAEQVAIGDTLTILPARGRIETRIESLRSLPEQEQVALSVVEASGHKT